MEVSLASKPRKKHEPVDARLLETACRLFVTKGFSVGIDEILYQSEVAKMSLYIKFKSKNGLIEKLLELATKEWEAEIDRTISDESLKGVEKILSCLKSICKKLRASDRCAGLIARAVVEFPAPAEELQVHVGKADHKKAMWEIAALTERKLIKALANLGAVAKTPDPDLAARQFLFLVHGYFITEQVFGQSKSLDVLLKTAAPLFPSVVNPSRDLFQEPTRRFQGQP